MNGWDQRVLVIETDVGENTEARKESRLGLIRLEFEKTQTSAVRNTSGSQLAMRLQ